MESHSQIEAEIAEWLARRDSGNWSQDEERRLQQWIAASTARKVAYLRLKSTWDAAARLRALRVGPLPGTSGTAVDVPPPREWRRSPFFEQSRAGALGVLRRKHVLPTLECSAEHGETTFSNTRESGTSTGASVYQHRRRRSGVAIAASVCFLAVAAFTVFQLSHQSGHRYSTPVGGIASLPMADGSNVTLNTDSIIRVAMSEKQRTVQLDQGEAFFDVAKDPARPFVVRAGSKRIVAVGTKFSVQHLGEDVRVVVTEGRVRVESDTSSPVLIAAGSVARADSSADSSVVIVQKAPPPQVEEFLSWREGYLRFHETALADAVAQINRYNTRKIFIEDPEIAALRISGTFRPTQYEAFVRVLRDGFAIQAQAEGERITLTRGP